MILHNQLKKNLQKLISNASILGLNKKDITFAQELLENRELKLCFDTIVTQLYECDIKIDDEFYLLSKKIIQQMKLSQEQYLYLDELLT